MLLAGVFQELIQLMLQQYEGPVGEFRDFLYTWEGLSPQGAITIFILVAIASEVLGSIFRRRAARIARRTITGASAWSGQGSPCSLLCCCRHWPARMSARC